MCVHLLWWDVTQHGPCASWVEWVGGSDLRESQDGNCRARFISVVCAIMRQASTPSHSLSSPFLHIARRKNPQWYANQRWSPRRCVMTARSERGSPLSQRILSNNLSSSFSFHREMDCSLTQCNERISLFLSIPYPFSLLSFSEILFIFLTVLFRKYFPHLSTTMCDWIRNTLYPSLYYWNNESHSLCNRF